MYISIYYRITARNNRIHLPQPRHHVEAIALQEHLPADDARLLDAGEGCVFVLGHVAL